MSIPPPHGMNEADYEAIEAAVTETVRGRWFLAEFARRNRMTETRQLLDAMARLEATVASGQTALPSADPSIRLLLQRIKEIAAGLGEVAGEMRDAGVEDHFVEAVDSQARAVAGMMRAATPALGGKPPALEAKPPALEAKPAPRLADPPRAEMPLASAQGLPTPRSGDAGSHHADPRLAALAALDGLPLAEKLELFR